MTPKGARLWLVLPGYQDVPSFRPLPTRVYTRPRVSVRPSRALFVVFTNFRGLRFGPSSTDAAERQIKPRQQALLRRLSSSIAPHRWTDHEIPSPQRPNATRNETRDPRIVGRPTRATPRAQTASSREESHANLNAEPDDLLREAHASEPAVHEDPSREVGLVGMRAARSCRSSSREFPEDASILDVGCASGWVKAWASPRGWDGVVGIDLSPPADIVGDVRDWKELGLEPHSFDVIVAFEVIEHCDIASALLDLLRPNGLLMVTTPVPRFDWICKALESSRILQPRVGPHSNLVDLRDYAGFAVVDRRVKAVIAEWGVLRPS